MWGDFLTTKRVPILQSKHQLSVFVPIWQSYTVMSVSFLVAVCFLTTHHSFHYDSELRRYIKWQFSPQVFSSFIDMNSFEIISKTKHLSKKKNLVRNIKCECSLNSLKCALLILLGECRTSMIWLTFFTVFWLKQLFRLEQNKIE